MAARSVGTFVGRFELTLDDCALRGYRARHARVRRQRAGWLRPRPLSNPWLLEAIGTAEWTGTPLARFARQAGLAPAPSGRLHRCRSGVQGGDEHDYARSLWSPTRCAAEYSSPTR